MIEIPSDVSLPGACPECGLAWTGFGTSGQNTFVDLACETGHWSKYRLSEEQHLRFLLANDAPRLLDLPMWLVGSHHPLPMPPLTIALAVPHARLHLDG